MSRRHLAIASACILPALLGSCSLLDSASQYLNIVDVKFSEENPASSGPSIGGPDVNDAVDQATTDILPTLVGGKGWSLSRTKDTLLGEYYLTDTFFVKGDNTGNTDTARFGTSLAKPVLLFRIGSRDAKPDSVTIEPFVVPGGQTADLKFPLSIPLTSVPSSVLDSIASGDSIPYYLTGTVKFELRTPAGTISGSSQSEIDLASGKIPTRPESLKITSLLKKLGL